MNINGMRDREYEAWYLMNVLMPRIKEMSYNVKKYIWGELFNEIRFEDAFGPIINYNLAHKKDIEIMKNKAEQSVVSDIMVEPTECIREEK